MTAQRGHPAWLHIEWAIWRLSKCCLLSVSCPPWNSECLHFSFYSTHLQPNPLTEPAAKQREHTVLTLGKVFPLKKPEAHPTLDDFIERPGLTIGAAEMGAVETARSNGPPSHRLKQSSPPPSRFCNPLKKRAEFFILYTPISFSQIGIHLGAISTTPQGGCAMRHLSHRCGSSHDKIQINIFIFETGLKFSLEITGFCSNNRTWKGLVFKRDNLKSWFWLWCSSVMSIHEACTKVWVWRPAHYIHYNKSYFWK